MPCHREDILAAASQHQVPVFLVEPTERYSSGIRITFDELDAFRELVTHLIEHHHVTKFACIAGFRGNPASETREMIFRDVLKDTALHLMKNGLATAIFMRSQQRR